MGYFQTSFHQLGNQNNTVVSIDSPIKIQVFTWIMIQHHYKKCNNRMNVKLPTVTLVDVDAMLSLRNEDDELIVARQVYIPDSSLPKDLTVVVLV